MAPAPVAFSLVPREGWDGAGACCRFVGATGGVGGGVPTPTLILSPGGLRPKGQGGSVKRESYSYALTIFSRPSKTSRVAFRVSTTNGAWRTIIA